MDDLTQLASRLAGDAPSDRAAAAERLCQLESGAQPAAVALVDATSDSEEAVREWASAALESMGAPPTSAVPELAQRLDSAQAEVAYWAATLLGRLAAAGSSAAESLGRLAGRCEAPLEARERAAWALGQMDRSAAAAAPGLQRAASSSSPPRLARLAEEALRIVGADSESEASEPT